MKPNIFFIYLFIIIIFSSCTGTPIVKDSEGYIEKLYSDVMNNNMRHNEVYTANSVITQFRFTSIVNIELLDTGTRRDIEDVTIIDDRGDRHLLRNSIEYNSIFYNLIHTIDIKKQKTFRVYYTVEARERRNNYEIERIRIDKIDNLMTRSEINSFQANESKILEEKQRQIQQAELEQKKSQARATIQRAIVSRNADTIMQSLTDSQSSFTSNRELLRGETIINDAYLAIARIASKNNNIQLEWFYTALENAGEHRLSSSEVIQIFNQNKVYYFVQLIVEQRIGDDYIIQTGYNDARRFIVLKNVKKVVNWDRKYWVLDVFMKYTGVSTLKLISGNIDVPTFDVIYQDNN